MHRSAVGGEPAPCPAVPVGGPENVAVIANTIPAVESHAALVPDVIREESQVAAPTVQDFRRSCFAHGSGRHPLLHPAASWIAGRRSVPGVTEDRLVVLPLSTRSMRCEWPGSRLARLPHASSESRVEARRVRPARPRRAMQDPAGDAWESGEFRGDGCWSSPFYCRAAEDRRACRTAGSTGGPLAAILCAQVIEMQGCPRAPGQNRRARPARSQAPSAIRATTAMSSWYAPRAIPSRGPARSLAAGQRRISAISRPLI